MRWVRLVVVLAIAAISIQTLRRCTRADDRTPTPVELLCEERADCSKLRTPAELWRVAP